MPAMLPDQYHPRSMQFWNGTRQFDEICQSCGHIARVLPMYAPDRGRNWLQCTNENCKKEWV